MATSTGYIIAFAAGVCVVCSLGVAGASMGLKPLIDGNETKAFQTKVLGAVGLPEAGEDGERPVLDADQTQALFDERLKMILVDDKGIEVHSELDYDGKLAKVQEARAAVKGTSQAPAVNPVYLRVDGKKVEAYALELKGKGLWGPISGYLALEPDGKTVMSSAFDAPKETPGLGAEIMTAKFQNQWEGKSIVGAGGKLVPIEVVKSADLACKGRVEHCVDGVSGATITSRGVDDMVEDAVAENYSAYLKKIQAGG